ncbi:adenosine deaminase [Aestuariibacter halophilus]|uniref:adenosine deaminase n=1 Tax=Fluctibacter halophilus TaxID=226011 RepID=A0ABS8G4U4_9ALTE|nr:adenosine deaminase [Aestuariibacter halophilus]MCC2615553.1 adenosine deaminase [Aestuariibacter halophilus]
MIDPTLPLVDLHRHLDGNILAPRIWSLAQQHGIDIGATSLEEVYAITQIQDKTSDLLAFLAKLDVGVSVLADLDACRQVAYDNMLDARDSQLDYVELRFSPYYMAKAFDLPMAALVEAVIDGVNTGSRETGVKANLIGILSRTFGAATCMAELDALLVHREHICALDLAGDELGYPAPQFVEHFSKARDAGWQVTVHAGEADGPQSVWNAIELLGAQRIGHGVAAASDPALMAYMAKNDIAIESCPTSNYQTATVSDLTNHPMAKFIENGLCVTLNTDDPAVSNITLAGEYQVAHEVLGLSRETLHRVQRNGVTAAFLSAAEKQALLMAKAR